MHKFDKTVTKFGHQTGQMVNYNGRLLAIGGKDTWGSTANTYNAKVEAFDGSEQNNDGISLNCQLLQCEMLQYYILKFHI